MHKPTLPPIYSKERKSSMSKSTQSSKEGDEKTMEPFSAHQEVLLINDSDYEVMSDSEDLSIESPFIGQPSSTWHSSYTKAVIETCNAKTEVIKIERQNELSMNKRIEVQKLAPHSKKRSHININLLLKSPSYSNSFSISPEQLALQQSWLPKQTLGTKEGLQEQCPSFLEQIDQQSREDECLSTLLDDSLSMNEANKEDQMRRRKVINISILSSPLIMTEGEVLAQEKGICLEKNSRQRFPHILSKRNNWNHCQTSKNANALKQMEQRAQVMNLIKLPPRKPNLSRVKLYSLKDKVGNNRRSPFDHLNVKGLGYHHQTPERPRKLF